ncbi:hypothetical protein BABINDRAFT_162445 [Babjeviella inositovora NRRL Y-12698]|uniref:PH-response regulator protein palI/RIM9 n=1 Tax=Babjeviella inositovora NRRL Y-12698 TaxID=984486 RepID=A0A1E3QP51_9ASCO|nr:uncharacterized protein BABINDRAFT_162445 [Babjeviella inositovora NRRL Y-12698]ODQ78757.1 hypothetical protein BABINDRAFT_162445 [Babjeviella inositovora NRRL Y-12698]
MIKKIPILLVVLLLVAFVCQFLSVLSAPVTTSIALSNYANKLFGVFGVCLNGVCSKASIGYPTSLVEEEGFSLPSNARHSVSKLLVVHPISAGFNFLLLAGSVFLLSDRFAASPNFVLVLLVFSFPTFLLTLLSFLVDILVFIPHLDWPGWIIIVSIVFIAVYIALLCFVKRSATTRQYKRPQFTEYLNTSNGELETKSNPDPAYEMNYTYGEVEGSSHPSHYSPVDDSRSSPDRGNTFDRDGYRYYHPVQDDALDDTNVTGDLTQNNLETQEGTAPMEVLDASMNPVLHKAVQAFPETARTDFQSNTQAGFQNQPQDIFENADIPVYTLSPRPAAIPPGAPKTPYPVNDDFDFSSPATPTEYFHPQSATAGNANTFTNDPAANFHANGFMGTDDYVTPKIGSTPQRVVSGPRPYPGDAESLLHSSPVVPTSPETVLPSEGARRNLNPEMVKHKLSVSLEDGGSMYTSGTSAYISAESDEDRFRNSAVDSENESTLDPDLQVEATEFNQSQMTTVLSPASDRTFEGHNPAADAYSRFTEDSSTIHGLSRNATLQKPRKAEGPAVMPFGEQSYAAVGSHRHNPTSEQSVPGSSIYTEQPAVGNGIEDGESDVSDVLDIYKRASVQKQDPSPTRVSSVTQPLRIDARDVSNTQMISVYSDDTETSPNLLATPYLGEYESDMLNTNSSIRLARTPSPSGHQRHSQISSGAPDSPIGSVHSDFTSISQRGINPKYFESDEYRTLMLQGQQDHLANQFQKNRSLVRTVQVKRVSNYGMDAIAQASASSAQVNGPMERFKSLTNGQRLSHASNSLPSQFSPDVVLDNNPDFSLGNRRMKSVTRKVSNTAAKYA